METGANHVLIVQGKKEHGVPYIEPFLCEVNIEKQQILVDWDEDC
jgi:16S rRNA processing protein RimM